MDLVERLRTGTDCADPCRVKDARSGCLCAEAADEIAFLRREVERLKLRVRIEEANV
jgi:hypothetical protein